MDLYWPKIETKDKGTPQNLDYKVFFLDKFGNNMSPWRDIIFKLNEK